MLKFHFAAISEKNRLVCPHLSVTKIACDQIRPDRARDRRIKSPSVSPALVPKLRRKRCLFPWDAYHKKRSARNCSLFMKNKQFETCLN